MIAKTSDTSGTMRNALLIGIGALVLSLVLSVADATNAFKSAPPTVHPLPIRSAVLPSRAFISQYWHHGYHETTLLSMPGEIAKQYQAITPNPRSPYDLVVLVGNQPGYLTTPEEYHPYVSQSLSHKWLKEVHIRTTQWMGQSGWTTWTVTRNDVVTRLPDQKALADPYLSPLEKAGLRHHVAATESIQANRPDRLGIIAEFLGTAVGPQKVSQFVRTLQAQEQHLGY